MAGRQWEERVPVVLASADRTGNEAMAPIWARAAVHDLMNGLYLRDDPDREDAITDLGLRFGLVTRFTSFVAVEEAFLRSIGGAAMGNAYGYGGLSLSGTGAGGGGVGYGTIGLGRMGTIGHGSGVVGGADSESAYGVLAARSPMMMMDRADGFAARPAVEPAPAPQIEAAAAEVRGSLSADTIRRTIDLHRAEIRGVYERQLRTRPDIEGRVAVRIVIGADGRVTAAEVTSSTIDCPELEAELLVVFRRMTFPPVEGGGTNVVVYPVVFVLSEDE
jgi:TonB family protein